MMPNPEDFGAVRVAPNSVDFGAVPVAAQHGPEPDVGKANAGLARSIGDAIRPALQTVEDMATVYAPVEAALNATSAMVFGFPTYLGAGVGTLISRGLGLTDADPKEVASMYSQAVTYQAHTEAGRRLSSTVMLPLTALQSLSESGGHKVTDVTGSPVAGALTEATIQMLPAPVISSLARRLSGEIPTKATTERTARAATGDTSGTVAEKMAKVYEETGIDPEAMAEAAKTDPTIVQDLASSNRPIPESLRQQAMGKAAEPPKPPEPPKPTETAAPEPTPGSAQETVLSRIVIEPPSTGRSAVDWMHHIYTQYIDRYHPIARAEAYKAMTPAEAAAAEKIGPYVAQRLTAGVAGKAKQFVENGGFDFDTYKASAPSYKSVMDMVKDDPKGFEAYIVAKHAIEREANGKATGIDLAAAKQVIADGKGKFEKASQARVKYKDALIDYAQKSGLLSEESVAAMRDAYKAHVPFYRFFEGEEVGTGGGKTPRSPVKRATGSERLILDPIASDIRDTFLFLQLAEANAARLRLLELGPDFVTKVPNPIRPIRLQETEVKALFDDLVKLRKTTKTQRTETSTTTGAGGEKVQPESAVVAKTTARVKDALTARGFSENEAEIMLKRVAMAKGTEGASVVEKIIKEINTTEYVPELDMRVPSDAMTIFRAIKIPTGPDEIAVMVDGKRNVYKVNPDLAEAYNGLDAGGASLLSGMLRSTASWLRAGVTLTPDFALRNAIRDALSAFVYAGSHPIKTTRGLVSLLKEDAAYQNWLKGGGANSAMVSIDRRYIEGHLYEMEPQTHLLGRAWNVANTPIEALRILSETLENMTRLGIARSELAQAKTKAQIQALAMITREGTVDFARHGADPFLRQWTRSTAFMNPAMQGADRMVRAFKDNPVGTTSKALAAITLPSVLLWWVNHKDPRYRDMQDWERDLFWNVFTDKWELPRDMADYQAHAALGLVKDIGGKSYVNNGHIFRIPKPFELGVLFGSVPERILDAYVADRPNAFKNMGETMANVFGFNVIPTAFIPPLQQATNYNFFTDRPLISDSMKRLVPEYQFQPYTTEATKALAHIIGAVPGLHLSTFASPMVIDNYIHGWTGTLGTYALQIADAALRKTGVLPDPVRPAMKLEDIPVIKALTVRYPSAGAQSIQDFYDSYGESQKIVATVNMLARRGDAEAMKREINLDPEKLVKLDGIHKSLRMAQQLIQLIDQNQKIDTDEKRQLIDTTYMQMIAMAHAGNEASRQIQEAMKGKELVH